MYQLLCGHLPFEGGSMTELMYKIANDPPANILDYNAALPDTVVRLVVKMLSKRPEDRFQTGTHLATAMRECRAELFAEVVDIGLDPAT
jgi:serine/threonine-protein kinase